MASHTEKGYRLNFWLAKTSTGAYYLLLNPAVTIETVDYLIKGVGGFL